MDERALRPFVAQLRREAFALESAPLTAERVGAEVELIPVDAATGAIAAIESDDAPSTLPALREMARRLGWREHRSSKAGVPELRTTGGGRITYEPGGQLEYAAPPNESVSALVDDLRRTASALREWLEPRGIELVSRGVDPVNAIEDVPLQLTAERYRRMDAHFASIGPYGARMMRQTASIQICLDAGPAPLERWRLLNALAPYLVAIFANSSVYAGEATGHRSVRRDIWGRLDPLRTGLAYHAADPVAGYADFAMRATAILLGDESAACVPFERHLARAGGADTDAWRAHLTTLFPEVRPRGYFEARSTDAIEPEWYAVPLLFLTGLTRHPSSARAALEIAGTPDPALLERAGRCGLNDPALAADAIELFRTALAGCESLGDAMIAERHLEVANDYFERYTGRGRSPASDLPATIAV
jgi:glutamate--cysteine ligase